MEDAWMVFALDQSISQMRHVPTRVDIESACVRARETMNGTQPPTAEQQPPTRARQANRHGGEDHLAFALRGREGPESRSARLGDNRVDFIRGKDFYATLRTRKDLLDELVPIDGKERSACEADAEREKRVTDVRIQRCGQALLQRGYGSNPSSLLGSIYWYVIKYPIGYYLCVWLFRHTINGWCWMWNCHLH